MCGISGIYNLDSGIINRKKFEKSLFLMDYRGPDAYGIKEFGDKVILGHLRLSVIDLVQENNQPFQIDDRYWVTYNGEIYNYIELKNELIAEGYSFRTSGDTEILLDLFNIGGRTV